MKQYLLPKTNLYKANLHCHSTISDGKSTPEELVEAYRSHGYSVLSITDHEVCIDHSCLNRNDFLLITGYEWACNDRPTSDPTYRFHRKTFHLNFLAKHPANTTHVCFTRAMAERIVKDPGRIDTLCIPDGDEERFYDLDFINRVIDRARAAGYLVAYNHPTWSLQTPDEYTKLHGLYAMEIYNHDCGVGGRFEYNQGAYDAMLRSGQRLGCIATDDAHTEQPFGHVLNDSFGGWTMIAAERLDYALIMKALENGDFYASCGPEIRELSYENGTVHVECSKAREINFTTSGRRAQTVRAERGQTLSRADFTLRPDDGYFRIEICDWEGMRADSRAYFLDELK